ncbi:MAG: FAD-dependent oxidoreductase [Kiritimatiellia bacterium]|nr:FAD-dependent oxidoreductase [Lentisphaerota bacterium]
MSNLDYDLIVIGAGPAGTAAAIAAGRRGCRVLLVEQNGYCGGMATAGLVNPLLGSFYRNPQTGRTGDLLGGIYAEVCSRLRKQGALLRFSYRVHEEEEYFSDAFDDAWLRIVYDRMLAEAGVATLFHTQLLEADCSGGQVRSVQVATKGGVAEFSATAFVDSTGDADLAALCGAGCDIGREEDGLCQPCSTMFRMGGIDKQRVMAGSLNNARLEVNSRFSAARERGDIDFPFKAGIGVYEFPRPGVLHFNATRMGGAAALTGRRLSELEVEGRRQVALLADWLVRAVPGFDHAFLESMAARVGVRETRRVRGRYTMTRQDVVEGARFDDGIARSAYIIDMHDPKGAGGLHSGKERGGAVKKGFRPKRYYEIPLRCLQPAGFVNLLVACRAISTDHYAHAATRVMGTLTTVGEAAGVAVGLTRNDGRPLSEIDGAAVRAELGYLDAPLGF